ncbi:hypothetical protein ACLB90_08775 [Stenotrophomonas sp. LGBM10]|uniref:hypothetical protein n=1 Tax=Stenotrophomonas sp. LGBM10 TaxID=3390038 RepID=UPI00398AAD26
MSGAARVLLLVVACAAWSFMAHAAEPVDAAPSLDVPYDGNHWAMLTKARIQARYLPAGLTDDQAIRRAVADGVLREAVYPSVQLADDVAYITTNALTANTLDRRRNLLALCPQADGFQLLLDEADRCGTDGTHRLRFEQDAAGGMVCAACASLGLPTHWERHDRPARCPLPVWDRAAAQRQFDAWQQRFAQDMQPYLRDATEAMWQARADAGQPADATVVPASRASAALVAMSTAPEAFADALGMPASRRRSDLLARLLDLLSTAEVSGRGGLYPEPVPELEGICAQVWYLQWPGSAATASVPAHDRYLRDSAPFITVQLHGEEVRLAGLSRELVDVLLAPAQRHDPVQD